MLRGFQAKLLTKNKTFITFDKAMVLTSNFVHMSLCQNAFADISIFYDDVIKNRAKNENIDFVIFGSPF